MISAFPLFVLVRRLVCFERPASSNSICFCFHFLIARSLSLRCDSKQHFFELEYIVHYRNLYYFSLVEVSGWVNS
jgi:hypothetical protein